MVMQKVRCTSSATTTRSIMTRSRERKATRGGQGFKRREMPVLLLFSLCLLLQLNQQFLPLVSGAWVVSPYSIRTATTSMSSNTALAFAKRSKKAASDSNDDLNNWYESVDADATPQNIFWEEMERQRLLSQIGQGNDDGDSDGSNSGNSPVDSVGAITGNLNPQTATGGSSSSSPSGQSSYAGTAASSSSSSPQSFGSSSSSTKSASLSRANYNAAAGQIQKSADATLSEYEAFAVDDNWLDEDKAWMMEVQQEDFDMDAAKPLDEQLDEWEKDDGSSSSGADDENVWMQSDEPWDHWGQTEQEIETQQAKQLKFDRADDFLLKDDSAEDTAELERERAEFEERLSKLQVTSQRLESARNSPKAAAFFEREPDALEGYDRLWVAAIDNVCFKNLVGTFRNYGIQFADNFGDWQDGCTEDGLTTIEDIASFKARRVFEVTGLPCIASRTSFEIEPVPNVDSGIPAGSRNAVTNANPRVVSGYRFNDIGMHVDYLCEALRPISEPSRVTRFKTCLCYYDGEMEIYDYGVCDCDILFANSMRTFIPVSAAINEMIKTLELTFGLQYQQWLKKRMEQASSGFSGASMKLRDRVLKEGRVLPNDIIDVSAFMDSLVDVNLMDECARDLAERFMQDKPSKILTIATTGLVIALPMAKYLQVPVVYARKERSVVMAETYQAAFESKTVGKNRELLVSKSHLHEDDRILVIDDFLASGASQEALLRIVSDSGATAVGVGVLLEKVYDAGRQSLSGFDVPIHSLCRVASVKSGVIQLVEEEGFDKMQSPSSSSDTADTNATK